MKKDLKIEIVSTTQSGKSSMSAPSRNSALLVLSRLYRDVRISIVNTIEDLDALVLRRPDVVLLGAACIQVVTDENVETIWLSNYLELHGISCSGSASNAHMTGIDKPLAKSVVLEAGLQSAKFYVASINETEFHSRQYDMIYPLFIKPTNLRGGQGVDSYSIANNFDQASSKINSIHLNYSCDSLIEEYLPGREFSVAILKNIQDDNYAAMPIEIVVPKDLNGDRLLSNKMKRSNVEVVTALTEPATKSAVVQLAVDAFKALGGRDYGRIDIRLDSKGIPHFLEVNFIPGIIEHYGFFPKACKENVDMTYEDMLISFITITAQRSTKAA